MNGSESKPRAEGRLMVLDGEFGTGRDHLVSLIVHMAKARVQRVVVGPRGVALIKPDGEATILRGDESPVVVEIDWDNIDLLVLEGFDNIDLQCLERDLPDTITKARASGIDVILSCNRVREIRHLLPAGRAWKLQKDGVICGPHLKVLAGQEKTPKQAG